MGNWVISWYSYHKTALIKLFNYISQDLNYGKQL